MAHRIDTATAQKDKFGAGKNGFTRGNPQTGEQATALDDDYFDMIQEEIIGIVEAASIVPDKTKHNQLLAALRALFLDASLNGSDIPDKAMFLSNLGAVAASGGDYNAFFNFKQVGTLPVDQNPNYLVTPDDTAEDSFACWLQNNWHGNEVKWGLIRGASSDVRCAAIEVGGIQIRFFPDGSVTAGGKEIASQEWSKSQFPLKTSLGNASTKTVGAGAGQIPDMNSFQSGSNGLGTWIRHPSGILIQFGLYPASGSSGGISFPTPFSEAPSYSLSPTATTGIMAVSAGATTTTITDVRTFNTAGETQTNGVSWMAIGR